MKKIPALLFFTILSLSGYSQNEFKAKINASQNDGIEFQSLTFISDIDYLTLGERNGSTLVGLHFESVNVPKGAIIDSAYLQFSSAENSNFNDNVSINIEVKSASEAFPESVGRNILTPRKKSNNWLNWNVEGAWSKNERSESQKSPNLTELVTEVIQLSDWKIGNPMTFFLFAEQETSIEMVSHDAGLEEHYPELTIYYSLNTSANDNETASIIDNLKLTPNPFHDELFINHVNPSKEKLSLIFFNSIGEKLYEVMIEKEKSVKVDFLHKGMYFIQVKQRDRILKTMKLVKA